MLNSPIIMGRSFFIYKCLAVKHYLLQNALNLHHFCENFPKFSGEAWKIPLHKRESNGITVKSLS